VGNQKAKEKESRTPASPTSTGFHKVSPLRISLPPKKKSSKKVAQKLIVKFTFGKKKKKSPKKSPKKSLMMRIPLTKLKTPVTPVKKTKTLAELKVGLVQKKMEQAMQGLIGSSRTSDTGGGTQTFGNLIPFTPKAALTSKTKH
jgi:hypothetical protein